MIKIIKFRISQINLYISSDGSHYVLLLFGSLLFSDTFHFFLTTVFRFESGQIRIRVGGAKKRLFHPPPEFMHSGVINARNRV
jgi:hypothetical protein